MHLIHTSFSTKALGWIFFLLLGFCLPLSLAAAPITSGFIQADEIVTGVITDKSGEPLIGASVLIKGTGSGTVTDFDGSFSIDAPAGSTLVVSYTGYATQEIELNGQTSLNITLEDDALALSEVVVRLWQSA